MKSFYIEVDTNDADYVGHLVTVPNEEFERFKSLIEKIKNFVPYEGVSESGLCYKHHHNFPLGDIYIDQILGKNHHKNYIILQMKNMKNL